ncbi:Putative sterol carrier protein [Archaeoglobus sulfaticallidus PM70-1]|uniref:Putative sterol carrier protein n=1 Tax=Archaeoglobus sulfaticallidus PM70-1 TaxID=387631 RepID=N0BIJ9_9EURY|nr:SCP2 sterol-binding domain-containing protein [Archaeoglobus sulfaticallidus]AGK62137.1 Putative sterol carrier protein [Archaeoglobus sulfaticallidus PM70-1]
MPKLFTQEWIEKYMEVLNTSKEYENAAKDWEGDFLFVIEPDDELDSPKYAYIDLYHGKARKGFVVNDPSEVNPAYVFSGKFSNWKKLLNGEIDPIKGLITRKFTLKGNMAKVMRYAKAAKVLVDCTRKVETEF